MENFNQERSWKWQRSSTPPEQIFAKLQQFAMKGNVVDLAVGVIIGGAFGKIVDSLVKDIVIPMVGRLLGGVDFKHLYLNLGDKVFETLEAAEARLTIRTD